MVDAARVPGPEVSVRMFRNDVLERLTHMHPATPWFVGVPLAAAMGLWAFRAGATPVTFAAGWASGLFLWTLLEYLLHRFVFHHRPKSAWGQRVHFYIHGVHHDYPNDASRLVMPPVLSLLLAGLVLGTLWAAFGAPWAPTLMIGLTTGYVAYDTIHYRTHHRPMRSRLGRALKRYHMRHHFAKVEGAYGVSSPLWDVILRTRPAPSDEPARDDAPRTSEGS